jgi:hypothetical protein
MLEGGGKGWGGLTISTHNSRFFMAQQTNLQIPSAEVIEFRIEDQLEYGKFYFSGLRKGQGITVANALRRVLLYDIQGIGITSLQFSKNSNESGSVLYNEFSSIPRFRESVLEIGINISSIVCGIGYPAPSFKSSWGPRSNPESKNRAVLEKRRFSLHKMFQNFGSDYADVEGLIGRPPGGTPFPNQPSFEVKGSQVFILQAKHIFDPKFWVVRPPRCEPNLQSPPKEGTSTKSSDALAKPSQSKTEGVIDSLPIHNSVGHSIDFEKNLDTPTIILKNPDHLIGSFFISYDSKKGFEYPDLDIEYTIGTLSDIQFRNEHLGENPGGINIGGVVSTLAIDLKSTVDKGSDSDFQISNDVMGDPNKKVGHKSAHLLKDSRVLLSQSDLSLNSNSFTCSNETNFFPVKKVNYSVQEKNFGEEVFLEIWTNRSLTPQEALSEALDSLISLFRNLSL